VVTGQLKPVLDSLVTLKKMGKWTEIVYLVLPGMNDGDEELRGLAKWVKTNLGTDVPLHFTQFHPQYLLKNLPITPVPTLERAKAIADAEGLHYVYIGKVPQDGGGARGVYGERGADPQGSLPVLPASDPRRLACVRRFCK
jgi:pyruvate formate lyase activating enzyme